MYIIKRSTIVKMNNPEAATEGGGTVLPESQNFLEITKKSTVLNL
jgi:hypothetical protein